MILKAAESPNHLIKIPFNSQFTPRELEVLRLVVEGYSNPEIASMLYISLSTAKTHLRSIQNRLGVENRVQVAVLALRTGLI